MFCAMRAMDTTAADERQQWDVDLVGRCRAGDTEAFHQLTQRYYRPVAAFILKRIARPEVVEDLTQDTFLEAFRGLKHGTRPVHVSSWLFGIARNICGAFLRRRRPFLFAADDPPERGAISPSADLEAYEEQERLLAALESGVAALPEETRRLLDLKHREGKTCEEIAIAMRRPVGTVKSLLSRTYKALRIRLRPGGEEGT
jgi:RNA polymerase sigma-70 factor (ECF subfamily)